MKRGLLAANIIVFAILCCFVFHPLRLGTDSVRLFLMALPASVGEPYGVDQFPPFYPHLLCFLMKADLCSPVIIHCINMFAFGCALLILYRILQFSRVDYVESMIVLLMVQMCRCLSDYLLSPTTDVLLLPFFWGALLALMHYSSAPHPKGKLSWLALAILLAVTSMTIRIASIPLFAVIAVLLTGITPKTVGKLLKQGKFWVVVTAMFGLIVVGVFCAIEFTGFNDDGGYFKMFRKLVGSGGVKGFFSVVWMHLVEVRELMLNGFGARWTSLMPFATLVTGAIALVAVIRGFHCINWCLMLAILAYGCEIFVWPYTSIRFFLPIYPFVAILIMQLIHGIWVKWKLSRPLIALYFLGFASLWALVWFRVAQHWHGAIDYHRQFAAESLIHRDYMTAYLEKLDDIPPESCSATVFLLKKFDPSRTMYESDKLSLKDYKQFSAEWRKR